MSGDMLVRRWAGPARRRAVLGDLLLGLPALLVAGAIGWRFGMAAGLLTAGLGIVLLAVALVRRARRFDRQWVVRTLDGRYPELEDSAGLLFGPDEALGPLQRLQRDRVAARVDEALTAGLRPAWPLRAAMPAWLGMLVVGAALVWSVPAPERLAPSAEGLPPAPGVPRLVGQRLRITPPAYTGLPARDADSLDARVPDGARLSWTLRFAPDPAMAAIEPAGGGTLALARVGGDWVAARTLVAPMLYRIIPAGAPARPVPPLHRIEMIRDAPPRIRVIMPKKSLTVAVPGQRFWAPIFEVYDDYGTAVTAQLRVTVAAGDGENVTFRDQVMRLGGTGNARVRRFAPRLDLAALGFNGPGDIVVQLIAADNRTPSPQVARSASLILRWPSPALQESGLEAMAARTLPAYFASQRQIIIDAEALIRQRRSLSADRFLARAGGIGADQQSLRLRYGQFLGEEVEGAAAPPTADDTPIAAEAHAPGAAEDITAEFGHVHDEPEAATLLDPGTRATLKQALDNMWQSELHLRQGAPGLALPFANKALGFIKQVQQATRIFLARVGTILPPIDEGRRMMGKRDGIADRSAPIVLGAGADDPPARMWALLQDDGGRAALPLGPLDAWVRGNGDRVSDPLALVAAIDAVRRDPGCAVCRQRLRGQLWDVLSRPPAAVQRRAAPDAAGRRYLQGIDR